MGCRNCSGLNVVEVSVADVNVEHEVKLMDSTKWLDRRAPQAETHLS